jgi:hypothetical protein
MESDSEQSAPLQEAIVENIVESDSTKVEPLPETTTVEDSNKEQETEQKFS